jgi:hypothetical protein
MAGDYRNKFAGRLGALERPLLCKDNSFSGGFFFGNFDFDVGCFATTFIHS